MGLPQFGPSIEDRRPGSPCEAQKGSVSIEKRTMIDQRGFSTMSVRIAVHLAALLGCGAALLLFGLQGCAPKVTVEKGLRELGPKEAAEVIQGLDPSSQGLNSWEDLRTPLERSLDFVSRKPVQRVALQGASREVTWGHLRTTLEHLLELLPRLDSNPELLASRFQIYELVPGPLFTGYFEPQIEASLEPRPGYPYPLYAVPEDLKTVDLGQFHHRWKGETLVYRIEDGQIVPYHDRAAIEKGALKDTSQVIAWARDLVDVFFLQIQGSGRLVLPDGRIQHVGYAGKNGLRYVSLGRVLVERDHMELEGLSMQSIRRFLEDNPELMPDILHTNPSFVFFRRRDGGPFGAMGRELTPRVSLAADPKIFPLGSVVAFGVRAEPANATAPLQVNGLGCVQDVGGAVKNHHLDLFFGSGDQPRYWAGHLKEHGRVFLLLSRDRSGPALSGSDQGESDV